MFEESTRRTAGPEILARSHGINVEIPKGCLEKMHGWCDAAKSEVSGYGLVTLQGGTFKVREVFLPEQRCSTGFTLIESEALGRLTNYLDRQRVCKRLGLTAENLPVEAILNPESYDLQFWWHTHYNFNTFWSGTDDDQAQKLAHQRGDWSLSLVINQKGDRLCRADFVSPVNVMLDNLKIIEVPDEKKVTRRDYERDIQRWVKPLERPRITWGKTGFKEEAKESTPIKVIFYAGKLVSLEQYTLLSSCVECTDHSCEECQINLKGIEANA